MKDRGVGNVMKSGSVCLKYNISRVNSGYNVIAR